MARMMPDQKLFSSIEPEHEAEPKLWFGESLSQPPLWRSLLDNLRERLFPPKLPPLELTSRPIAVAEETSAFHYGKTSAGLSLAVHAAALGAFLALSVAGARVVIQPKPTISLVEPPVGDYVFHVSKDQRPSGGGGGGGGGSHDKLPAPKGRLPKVAMIQLAPPAAVIRNEHPKLTAEPTVVAAPELQLPQTAALNLGDPMAAAPGPPSNGPGLGGGIGSGRGGGVGSGTGPGVGPGHGGGFGGGVFRVGGGISAPRVIEDPKPEYSDEARKAKFEGTVVLWLIVDSNGKPRDVKVVRSLGMGLDEKAVEAVRLWKFRPAMKDGSTPVAVEVNVEVNFHLL
jgi:protein TonB